MRPFLALLSAACVCLPLLAGCAPRGSNLPDLPAAAGGPYRLGAGDQVRIVVFAEERLTGEFRVSDTGDIALPLLGTVKANGRSTRELEQDVAGALKAKGLFRDANVSVEVLKYRPVFILGQVSKPGEYSYQPNMTVLTAATIAGGFTPRAQEDFVAIQRTVDGAPMEGKARRLTLIQPGDVITVFERLF